MSHNDENNNINLPSNFIHNIIDKDIEQNLYESRVHTRFPPEPNGYLHIGHAKAICINFGTAQKYNGLCNLRFDDTNPSKEDTEYVQSIQEDIKWLGFDWEDHMYYASNYFEKFYQYAVKLIKKGKAFVCDLSAEEIREHRGTLTEPGKQSPYRKRSVKENLELFEKMKNGEFQEGSKVLRAKIDMKSPNLNMRDPVIYRIQYSSHHRTGDKWCIYPMYDYAHPLEDAIEGITHSLCSLEFEDHRPLYDWVVRETEFEEPPKQIEFARLNLKGTVMSKRKLRELVENGFLEGWDDPRIPTLSGLRRRGYTPESIRNFCELIGVSKSNSVIDMSTLDHCIREDLKLKAPRGFGVLKPLKVVITNYPDEQVEWLDAEINQEHPEMGSKKIPFSKVIYIEQEDFMENPTKKYFRLSPDKEVRLKYAYFIKCQEVIKDKETGEIIELRCTYDPETKSGTGFTGRKVKGTLHWVSAKHAVEAEVRLYDRLLLDEDEQEDNESSDWKDRINSNSLEILKGCLVEPAIAEGNLGDKYQFFRHGYFSIDPIKTNKDKLVFNRIVALRDTWKKIKNKK